MKSHFKQLYLYNQWANDLFADQLGKGEHSNEKINLFFSHIATAQLIWLNRVKPITQEIPEIWAANPVDKASELLHWGNQKWLEFIDTCVDFDEAIHYTTTTGEESTTVLKDILTHVANHGTHHRGQIALLLREEGIAPPASDFIFYLRA